MLLRLSSVVAIVALAVSSTTTVSAAIPGASINEPPSFLNIEGLAPVISSAQAEIVPDSYFVVFKGGVRVHQLADWVSGLHADNLNSRGSWYDSRQGLVNGGDGFLSGVKHVYDMESFQGLSGRFRPEVIDKIRESPYVDYIERDQMVYASETQTEAPWGLARISHRKLSLRTRSRYEYDPKGGEGVTVFVIDTGINIKHQEFQGRASWGKTIPRGDTDVDGNGHGTHCAGTIGSAAYGVAKKAKVVAVKVLRSNGSGTMSDVVAGVDYVVKTFQALKTQGGAKFKGSVANMSLGGGKSRPLDSVVKNAVSKGLHFAVAAGNDDDDACNFSPAGVPTAVTVGASTIRDERAYFSNYGTCVDIFGPGLDIQSTWIGGPGATRRISGTSMASPHVAGLIAYYLSLLPDKASGFNSGPISPQEMKDYLKSTATKNVLRKVDSDTPNLLIFNGGDTKKTDDEFYYEW